MDTTAHFMQKMCGVRVEKQLETVEKNITILSGTVVYVGKEQVSKMSDFRTFFALICQTKQFSCVLLFLIIRLKTY